MARKRGGFASHRWSRSQMKKAALSRGSHPARFHSLKDTPAASDICSTTFCVSRRRGVTMPVQSVATTPERVPLLCRPPTFLLQGNRGGRASFTRDGEASRQALTTPESRGQTQPHSKERRFWPCAIKQPWINRRACWRISRPHRLAFWLLCPPFFLSGCRSHRADTR